MEIHMQTPVLMTASTAQKALINNVSPIIMVERMPPPLFQLSPQPGQTLPCHATPSGCRLVVGEESTIKGKRKAAQKRNQAEDTSTGRVHPHPTADDKGGANAKCEPKRTPKWKARWWWFVIRYRGTNKWRIFEAIGLGSVVIYTGVTFQQWHLARQQLVGTLGAVLEATSGGNNAICGLNGAGKEGELVCTFSNIGHVTATVKHLELSVSDGVLPQGRAAAGRPIISLSQDNFEVTPEKPFSLKWHLTVPEPLGPSASWPNGWPGEKTYVINGRFSYDNGFGDVTSRQFCNVWLPPFAVIGQRTPTGKQDWSSPGMLINCTDLGPRVTQAVEEEKKAVQAGQ